MVEITLSSQTTTCARSYLTAAAAVFVASSTLWVSWCFRDKMSRKQRKTRQLSRDDHAMTKGGYESLIGNTPLLYLPHISSLINDYITSKGGDPDNKFTRNPVRIFVKMENMNPGGTGKDRAARSMILASERSGDLPPPLSRYCNHQLIRGNRGYGDDKTNTTNNNTDTVNCTRNGDGEISPSLDFSNVDPSIHQAILIALHATKTHGIVIEGTSGSTGISLASLASPRGHGVIVVLPDDQSTQKSAFLKKLGCGVVVVKNCSISNPGHYVNVAKRVWELIEVERRYDAYYQKHVLREDCGSNSTLIKTPPKLLKAAFMNQFDNLANVVSHYTTTGPEIHSQLDGKVNAFVMSAGTGGTLVGVGGYLKEKWWENCRRKCQHQSTPPKIVLVDPPGSSLFNKVKYGVAYAPQQSERSLRRHRYDTLAEGIGLDRVTANFGLGCDEITWKTYSNSKCASFGNRIALRSNSCIKNGSTTVSNIFIPKSPTCKSKIVDDAIRVTDQQAVNMAHYLLRHEGLFVGSSTAMNIVGAMMVASRMEPGCNVVTVVCDGGQRHTSRFWNPDFVVGERGLVWPAEKDLEGNILELLDISHQI
mmetsp:Transcript_30139/g.57662  ORF Transcript_30139/g.57662 Transcript_30139/m.57662 type:complete len:592 (-) Transcript_30139:172-1947(-)